MLIKIGKWISWAFPNEWNPLDSLGALSFYLFWIVTMSGVYLFVFFDTSLSSAWQSVEQISNEQYYIGSVIRGLHRYASTTMAITVTLHLFRELALKRYLGARWFSWVSGVPLLWLLFASALGGYWMVWDEKAQYIAQSTATLFDALPIIVEPIAFGFLTQEIVSDRFFTLLIFLHVGIPLSLLMGMFIHLQRLNHSNSTPPKKLAISVLCALILLSLVMPATSMPEADLDKLLANVEMDWVYMNVFPLIDIWGPGAVWAFLGSITFGLLSLPFVVPLFYKQNRVVARVDPEFCNGCSWCYADCPFDAIYMKPHESRPRHRQAVVIEDRCVGCGICAGACPTITPFKSVNEAHSGIDLVGSRNFDVLQDARQKASKIESPGKILIVGCNHGTDVKQFEDKQTVVESLECIGQLPPSYLDFLCRRDDVEAVLLTGCRSGSCYHRLGIELQEERLVRLREPHLKYADVGERIDKLWIGKGSEREIESHIRDIKLNLEGKNVA
jgi:ferredoxin/coenzyme F420-reducing hydrogenase delta subunit